MVPGTFVDVAVSVTNNTPDDIASFLALAPIDPDTMYVMGSAYGGAFPLTAAHVAKLATEKGLPELDNLVAAAAGRAPEDVVAVAWMGAAGGRRDSRLRLPVQVISQQRRGAARCGAVRRRDLRDQLGRRLRCPSWTTAPTRSVAHGASTSTATPSSTAPSRQAFNGSGQTMWTGFFGQMRPLVHTPLNGIPGDAYVDVAYLYLYIVEGRGFTNWSNSVINVEARPVTTQWMPDAANWWTPWTMAGGDYGPAVGTNHIGSAKINTWLRLEVTDAVSDMLRGGSDQGFIVTNTTRRACAMPWPPRSTSTPASSATSGSTSARPTND